MDKNIVKSQFNNIYDNKILLNDFTGQGELCENYSTLIVSSKMFITVPINITGEVHFSNNYVDWNIKVNLNLGETSEDTKNRFITVKGKYFRVLLSSSNTELESTYLETSLSKVHIDKNSDDGNDVDMNDSLNTINSSVNTTNTKLDMNNNLLDSINSTNTDILNSLYPLRKKRNAGQCFSVTLNAADGLSINNCFMSLYNPFDNNKTLYVYQISGSLQTTNVYTSTDIYSFIGYSNPGTMFTPHNVSFGHSSISTMECFIQGTLVGRSKFESFRVKSGANPTFLDFQEDIIKFFFF